MKSRRQLARPIPQAVGSVESSSPECTFQMHKLCPGPKVIRREGAPAWEAPILTLRCGCRCHRRPTPKTGVSS